MKLIVTEDTFQQALEFFLTCPRLSVDTETYYIELDKPTPFMLGMSVYGIAPTGQDLGAYFPFRHEHEQTLFQEYNLPLEWIEKLHPITLGRQLIFHNAQYDVAVLEKDGFVIPEELVYDTMLLEHMVDENQFSFELDSVARKYELGTKWKKKELTKVGKQLGGWHKIPPSAMGTYANQDTKLPYKAFNYIWPQVQQQELSPLWHGGDRENEQQYLQVLKRMKQRGIGMNVDVAKRLAYDAQARLQEIQSELGFDPGKASLVAQKLFEAPPVGLGFQPPRSVRKDGLPTLDADSLSPYDHPVPRLIIEYRHEQKALSTWFAGFLAATHADHRIHPSMKRHGTVTARLSCDKPNVQQLPKVHEENRRRVFSMFTTHPGNQLWEFDYSQAEFRLGGCYTKDFDPAIADAYAEGVDFHQLTADRLGIPRGREGGPINGKDLNFTMFYGAGGEKVATSLFGPEPTKQQLEQAVQIRSDWWEAYPGLKTLEAHVSRKAREEKYIRYWSGRRRHFKWSSEAYKALNSLMQGGVGEIVRVSMTRLDRAGFFLVSQVHDAIWIEIPEDSIDESVAKIKAIMEWPTEYFKAIAFPVDAKRLA